MIYTRRLCSLLSPAEHRVFQKLQSPERIQDFLDHFPINFERGGETLMSPRRVLQENRMHCMEGALFAATSLAYHAERPLLLDFQTTPEDEDHVVALFKINGLWGAISKTNHPILRYRDPVYKSVRELALSYFHEYVMWQDGRKTLRAYSRPFDLCRYAPEWVVSKEDLDYIAEDLDNSLHFPIAPLSVLRRARKASVFERHAFRSTEWKKSGKRGRF